MSRSMLRRYFRHGLFPQLMVFEAVARLGSVTRAARELHLAQPTVSMQLKKLARTLEVVLFEPDGRRLQITPAGEALLDVCRELSALLMRADERLLAFRKPAELPLERLARLAAGMVGEASEPGAYNSPDQPGEKEPWISRVSTTRR